MGQLYLDATNLPTSLDTHGRQRTPAAQFVQLAKGLDRTQKQGWARQPGLRRRLRSA